MQICMYFVPAVVLLCRSFTIVPIQLLVDTEASASNPPIVYQQDDTTVIRRVQAVQVMEVPVPEGGANGAAVVYHPKHKLYYAAQAGNEIYPLVVFDENGQIQSSTETSTLIDVRGLWYNPNTGTIAGNAFRDAGWFDYTLNSKGIPEELQITNPGLNQPDEHSAGIFNPDTDEVMFLADTKLVCYRSNGEPANKTIQLFPGEQPTETDFSTEYNTRSVVYTGEKAAELGLLNVVRKRVELYSIQTGRLTRIILLPINFTPASFFNFSYCNGLFWLFHKQSRRWVAFKEAKNT